MDNKINKMPVPVYDPREEQRRRQQQQQQPQQQSQQQQKQQQPVQPVKSNLPPITYQQKVGAIVDPRFSQALAQKLQQDVTSKQAALQQKQAEFQSKLSQANTGITGAQARIGEILTNVQAGRATPEELAEYQNLQQAQYRGPTGLEGVANIAALSQLAASPEMLAQQYAGFGTGGVRGRYFEQSLAGVGGSELSAARQAAAGLAQQAMSAEEVAAQQAALLKGQTEAAKEAAETGSKAALAQYTGEVTEQTKAEREAKDAALKSLKEGFFLTGQIKDSDIRKLGLDPNDPNVANVLASMEGLDLGLMGLETYDQGGTSPRVARELNWSGIDLKELDRRIEQIDENQLAGNPVTEEEKKLSSLYKIFEGVQRSVDEETTKGALSFAKKEDLSKINALRRLRGEAPLTEADLGKKLGGIGTSELARLSGTIRQDSAYSDIESVKNEKKSIEDNIRLNNELGERYKAVLSGKADAGRTINDLEKYAKENKDWNSHANWLYERLQRGKTLFGWDTGFIKSLLEGQTGQVEQRKTEYEKQYADTNKKLKERSKLTRKMTRVKD